MVSYKSYFSEGTPIGLQKLILSDPDGFLQSGLQIKHDKTTTVAKVDYKDRSYLVKRYNPRSRWHKVKRAFRESRASICWYASKNFLSAGINVPLPVAMIERRVGLIRGDAFFVSEWFEAKELLDWLPLQEPKVIDGIGKSIVDFFKKMQRNDLSHGDMKATNLLWSNGKLVVVDLDSAKKHKTPYSFGRAHKKDKARFERNGEIFAGLIKGL